MSTTLNKLEYLDETKKEIKNALNTNFNSGITDEDTFRSYVGKINDIYTNWAKVTGTGTEITLNNTKKGKMALTPKGNTEQNGTPTPDSPIDVRVVTGNNSVKVIGKNLFDTTITKTAGDGRIEDTTLETGKKLTWNGASATTGYMWLGYVIKDITNYVGKIVRFKTNFSASASNTPQYAIGICDSDGDNRTSKASSSTSGNTISFTIPSLSGTQTYLYVLLYANSGGTLNPNDYVDFTNMILTIDNEDMTYIPYQSQTYPINLGTMELCKIDTYEDYIYKENNKWYKHSEIGKVVLDGSEENLSYNSTANRLQMPFNLQTQDWGTLALTLCDHFTMGDTEIVDGSFNITRTILFFKNMNLTSLNDWKTWLGSNNTTVYYVLETSINTEITDTTLISQLNAIENAVSYDTQTNISSEYVESNAQMIISASALEKGGN